MKPVKEVKKGEYIVHRNEPCKIMKKENVTFSSHSHTKLKIDLEGLFSNFKETVTLLPHESVEDVEIIRKKGQVVARLADKVQVMDLVSYETMDGDVDRDLLEQLNEGDEVTFVGFNEQVKVLEKR
ncbi:MAG: hypothetical protein GY861_06460 [bacterium]|nr:hypothetical protein [bacterium]